MIYDAPAKINLSLRVLAREAGGFHQIETLFCALELCDEVEVERQPSGIALEVAAHDSARVSLPANARENLVYRAARSFFDATQLDGGAHIRLTKRIPTGAGLGGGSSDAAATIAALNELYARPLTDRGMLDIAAQLGSDIPFFLCGTPLALAWSRGTRMISLPPLPRKPILLVWPGESVATADAYEAFAATRATQHVPEAAILDTQDLKSWRDVAANSVNDLEPVIFERIPELEQILAQMRRLGAIMARMTGTGSVVFGVFEDEGAADAADQAVRKRFVNVRTILTHTAQRG